MDILGSALTSPTVSWTINRKISTTKKVQKRTQEPDEETIRHDKQPAERSGTFQTYQTGEWETPIKRSFQRKMKELFQRVRSGSTDEAQPLLITRPKSKPIIPRDKLKMAGKRLRKALHQSIRYMAIGMENMSTMVYISANVPSSVYYSRNNYDSNIPSFY